MLRAGVQLHEAVGHGATAAVYRGVVLDPGGCASLRNGQVVAVKRVFDKPKAKEALASEAAILQSIRHPNIVQFLGVFRGWGPPPQEGPRPTLLLEYCDVGSITNTYADEGGPFEEERIKRCIFQLLNALQYLHARNIVHRDIKGMNSLLTSAGMCKVADFGAAVNLSTMSDRQFHSEKGTRFWMAPEVLALASSRQSQGGGPPSDIWSLGATAWEMAVAARPHHQLRSEDELYQHFLNRTDETGMLPEDLDACLGPNVAAFVRSTMRLRPEDRPTAEQLLNDPFFDAATRAHYEALLTAAQEEFRWLSLEVNPPEDVARVPAEAACATPEVDLVLAQ